MASYVLARSQILDAEGYRRYSALAGPTVAAHGGRFVVKGAVVDHLEGADPSHRVAVIAFPSAEDARAWVDSEAYRAAQAAREGSGPMVLTLLEG